MKPIKCDTSKQTRKTCSVEGFKLSTSSPFFANWGFCLFRSPHTIDSEIFIFSTTLVLIYSGQKIVAIASDNLLFKLKFGRILSFSILVCHAHDKMYLKHWMHCAKLSGTIAVSITLHVDEVKTIISNTMHTQFFHLSIRPRCT